MRGTMWHLVTGVMEVCVSSRVDVMALLLKPLNAVPFRLLINRAYCGCMVIMVYKNRIWYKRHVCKHVLDHSA